MIILIIISVLLFLIGTLLFLLNSSNLKQERDYLDNFKFMISDHDDKNDYFSLFNQLKMLKLEINKILYNVLVRTVGKGELFNMLPHGGIHLHVKIVNFYMYYLLEIGIGIGIIMFKYTDNIKIIIYIIMFIFINSIFIKILFNSIYIKKEKKKLKATFCYFLDTLASATKSGLTIDHALIVVSEFLSSMSSTLSMHINDYSNNISSNGHSEAGEMLRRNIKLQEVVDFTSVLENSIESGSSVSIALRELSSEIRQLHFIETEEKIGRINAQMGIPLILFIMFPIIVEIIAPGVLNLMSKS